MQSAVIGAMSEHYRREIGGRTGKAGSGEETDRRSRVKSETGDREIDPEHAAVVVRIFERYADGVSPRAIAERLNNEHVPSPGSTWNRGMRRRGGWAQSAIAGDLKRGTGILNNEIYIGRIIWNRFTWVRSAADSSKRKCIQNPESEWIVHEDESLRIVPQRLWNAV